MPAAAVIPAPVAYIKAVAVKKLVVGYQCVSGPACPVRGGGNAHDARAPKCRLAAFNACRTRRRPFFGGACRRPAVLP